MANRKYTDDDIIEAVKSSHSYREVCRKLNLCDHGGSPSHLKKIISNMKLDTSHFTGKSWAKGESFLTNNNIRKKDISEILIENSGWNSHNLKNRLLKENIKEYKCECCNNSEWNGKPIPLELHHINGIHTDNRLENLQLLCCNCHAQTETYSKQKNINMEKLV